MERVIKTIFDLGPLIFAFGFLTPLIAQILEIGGIELPLGLSPLHVGLIISSVLGVTAQIRGKWL